MPVMEVGLGGQLKLISMVSPVAVLTDVHVIKGGTFVSGWRPKLYKQISQHAHSTADQAIGSIFLGVKPAFLKIGSAQFPMVMDAK